MEIPLTAYPERRRWRRLRSVNEHGIVRAQVRPGLEVVLIDLSARGAQVETRHRLPPGAYVDVLLSGQTDTTVVRGQVLRCGVASLQPAGVAYRGGIAFEPAAFWSIAVGGEPGIANGACAGRDAPNE